MKDLEPARAGRLPAAQRFRRDKERSGPFHRRDAINPESNRGVLILDKETVRELAIRYTVEVKKILAPDAVILFGSYIDIYTYYSIQCQHNSF